MKYMKEKEDKKKRECNLILKSLGDIIRKFERIQICVLKEIDIDTVTIEKVIKLK